MVHSTTPIPLRNDGTIDIDQWVDRLDLSDISKPIVRNAVHLAEITGIDATTPFGANCLRQGLESAEILTELEFDAISIATAVIYPTFSNTDFTLDEIAEQLGPEIATLIRNVDQMSAIDKSRHLIGTNHTEQIDNIRKMLLAMVKDVRAIVIKLADRLTTMRAARKQSTKIKQDLAKETFNIFSPLANRLGLHHIKWELEDISYLYLYPKEYLEIANALQERRTDRNKRVDQIVATIQTMLQEKHIKADVYGRAKHIYSIKRKMQRKNLPLEEIYDIHAIRILVDTEKDCYEALSIVHEIYTPIQKEFDDYISSPKPNGYQSIHTAVLDKDGKNFEIQIRTHQMHKDAEMGVAAHWIYKEGKRQQPSYEEKITWLRYLLDWQKELSSNKKLPEELEKKILEDRVYVFTPAGDIFDLPSGATPIDFAYHIHSEVGHRCRGAKISGKIVPLTYALKTGDQVEILTAKKGGPSRDWLIPQRGYLKTSGARAKVLQWFKQQNYDIHVTEGRAMLDRELQRLNIDNVNLSDIAKQLNFKNVDLMLASIGNGNLRIAQVIHAIPKEAIEEIPLQVSTIPIIKTKKPSAKSRQNVTVCGVGDLLSRIANCCRPLPGDPIVGYIASGEAVTIHHRDCKNIAATDESHQDRLIEVEWSNTKPVNYAVNVEVLAYDRPHLLRDITTLLANNKTNITNLTTAVNNKKHEAKIVLTVEVNDLNELTTVLDHIQQIPNIHTVRRLHND